VSSDLHDALHNAARAYARADRQYRAAYAAYYAKRPDASRGVTPATKEWKRFVVPQMQAAIDAQERLQEAARAFSVGDP
jgi:hypothetical protein